MQNAVVVLLLTNRIPSKPTNLLSNDIIVH